jgi:hypothetical protein
MNESILLIMSNIELDIINKIATEKMPLLVAGLAQQLKHISFVSFYPWLVERIYTQKIAAYRTGFFEEII